MEEEVNIASTIIDSINSIFQTLFSSIDMSISYILDEVTFIDSSILDTSYFSSIFGRSSSSGILLISNSLIFGFLLYYATRLLLSHLLITQVERPSSFVLKLVFYAICMNCSLFICERLIFFNDIICSFIREIGGNLFGSSISFSNLFDKINSIIVVEETNFNLFSIDGILKSFLSVSLMNLAFTYSIRFILIKVFVLIAPFAFLSLSNQATSSFFKAWFKCFICLLLVQIFIAFILVIIFSMDFNPNDSLSKFLICGSIFSLIKANDLVRQFLGGISTDISTGMRNLSSVLKT
ncbi:MAG: hypothetical protein J6A04_06075 [Clostridia bacterium]|nr:hypothetical protein [Clostridia bacterium]